MDALWYKLHICRYSAVNQVSSILRESGEFIPVLFFHIVNLQMAVGPKFGRVIVVC